MKRFYFVGIKGSGMSSLAQILHDNGESVCGSDIAETLFTEIGLRERGIEIFEFNEANISPEYFYIVGNAFDNNHPEVRAIREQNLDYMRYQEFLGRYLNNFISIGVSGAHGKTSTTSLLAHTLGKSFNTSFLIGDGTGQGEPNSKFFVFEACEYKRHFLAYKPDYAIITNIDFDHPDYFEDLEDVQSAFISFANNAKRGVVVCGDDQNIQAIISKIEGKNVFTYGLSTNNDLTAYNIWVDEKGTHFDVKLFNSLFLKDVVIPLFGNHSILNSLAVLATLILNKVSANDVFIPNISSFEGAKRRFSVETKGDYTLIDDYAHHPTEIKATIEAAKLKYPNKKIIAVFQPHTFSRTTTFLNEFANSLNSADKVYGCPIFGSAREQAGDITIQSMLNLIPNSSTIEIDDISELLNYKDDVLLFMGAGDITKYIAKFKDSVQQ